MSCSICMGEVKDVNKIITPCKHIFCNTCLTQWLMTNHSCPMCRKEFGNKTEEENEDSEDDIELVEEYMMNNPSYVSVINQHLPIFEDVMFDLIDNIDDEDFLRDGNVQRIDNIYVMKYRYHDNNKIIGADIIYEPDNGFVKMTYNMEYDVPKNKRRNINRNKKDLKRMNRNIKSFNKKIRYNKCY